MKDFLAWNRRVLVPLVFALQLSLISFAACAQEPGPPNPTECGPNSIPTGTATNRPWTENNQSNSPDLGTDSFNPDPPRPPMAAVSPLFRLAGNGLVNANHSPLRVGPIYVSSAEVLGAYNAFSSPDRTQNLRQTGTIMRSDIVLDERFKSVKFVTQWEPRLSILDGVSRGDLGNGASALEAKFDLTNRLDLLASDNFSYFASRVLFGDYFWTPGVVQNPMSEQNSFLDAPGHALSNNAIAILNYQLSPLTRIYFSPSFSYFHTTTSSALLDSGRQSDGTFGLNHALSERTSIGLKYDLAAISFKLYPDTVLYNTVSGTYAHLFSPSLSFTGSAGVSTYQVSNNPRSWSFAGSATLTKEFRTSMFSLAYFRGLDLADYITTDFTDRLDGKYNQSIGRRLTLELGAGFQREARKNGFQGQYAQTSLNFRLFSRLSVYGRYTYWYQTGDQHLLVTGTRNLVVVGLRFEASTPIAVPNHTSLAP